MRFELPAEKTLVFDMVLPMRWGDMDAYGHINNTVYFRYFESLRVDWLLSQGRPLQDGGMGPVVVNAFCSYLRQVTYPGELRARLYVGQQGRSSMETFFTLERSDEPGITCAEGGATMVWMDFATGRSTPMPDWLRQAACPAAD